MRKRLFLNKLTILFCVTGIQIFAVLSLSVPAYSSMLPASIISLPENENALLVEKKTQTLFIYSAKAKELSLEFKIPCSTGEIAGLKQKAGDKKTPEGIYFLKDEYEDKYLTPVYGKKAFPTDYPNFLDKRTGKNGSAIWIHGTNKELKPMDSNGCIALENSNILRVADYVNLDSTPIIMVEQIDEAKKAIILNQKNDINQMLDQWLMAVEKESYHEYLSLYSPRYFPDINWWENWLEIRDELTQLKMGFGVKRENTGIYSHDGVFVVIFDYLLTIKNETVLLGKKNLFLEKKKTKPEGYEIIGDTFQSVPEQFQKEGEPLTVAAKKLVKPALTKESVVGTLKQWLAAWSSDNLDTYATFYADDFHSDGMNKKTWVKRKRMLAKKYEFINVSGSEFKVKEDKDICYVSFSQKYESSGLSNHGIKSLKLVKKGGLWKIYQESWKRK
jgi:murein L,D-transpeptidase YafK